MRGYPQFSFWISITLVMTGFSRIFNKPRKNTCKLVGTVLKLFLDEFLNTIWLARGRVTILKPIGNYFFLIQDLCRLAGKVLSFGGSLETLLAG